MTQQKIESLMTEQRLFPPDTSRQQDANIKNFEEYQAMHKRSMEDMEGFWGRADHQAADLVQEVGQGPGVRLPQA